MPLVPVANPPSARGEDAGLRSAKEGPRTGPASRQIAPPRARPTARPSRHYGNPSQGVQAPPCRDATSATRVFVAFGWPASRLVPRLPTTAGASKTGWCAPCIPGHATSPARTPSPGCGTPCAAKALDLRVLIAFHSGWNMPSSILSSALTFYLPVCHIFFLSYLHKMPTLHRAACLLGCETGTRRAAFSS